MTFKPVTMSIVVAVGLIANIGYAQVTKPAAEKPAAVAAPVKPLKITVNGAAIPASRFQILTQQATGQGQPDSPQLQAQIKDNLVKGEIVAQEAVKIGLDKNPEITEQLDLVKHQLLVRAYVTDFMKKNPIKDDVLKAEYNKVKSTEGDKEYKAQHILVEGEKEAKDLIAQIKKGASFDKLAKEKSKDAGSKEQGGKLEWTMPTNFVKPFSDAMIKLKKGDMTQEPVKTPYGYHIIKLDDTRAAKVPSFDEVKDKIRQTQQQALITKMLEDLRAKAKVDEK
ncbi:MAG: peptidylprolyl isomerase [Burkholderiales bacterium]|nr:peptidylprolyl isomerase [Pseudomonadota bacterium]